MAIDSTIVELTAIPGNEISRGRVDPEERRYLL
jgi:hypothetical protein